MLLQQNVTAVPTTENPIVLYVWIIGATISIIVTLVLVLKYLYKQIENKNVSLVESQKLNTDRYINHSEKMTAFLTSHSDKITQAVDDNSRATEELITYIKTRDETLRDILKSMKQ